MTFRSPRTWIIALAAIGLGLTAQPAKAGYIDLTSSGSSTTINGAFFNQADSVNMNAGTGLFPSFVQLTGNDGIKQAFNSTNAAFDNGNSAQHNYAIQMSDLRIIIRGGQSYFKFVLDINESKNADRFLSLDALQVYTSTTPNLSSASGPNQVTIAGNGTLPDLGTQRYNMGAGNGVLLDYSNASGSGFADLSVYIPVFSAAATDYVYLYSKVGAAGLNPSGGPAGNYANSDGFEEWAIGQAGTGETDGGSGGNLEVVPAPAGLILLVSGLPILALRRVLRRKPAVA